MIKVLFAYLSITLGVVLILCFADAKLQENARLSAEACYKQTKDKACWRGVIGDFTK